jgi:hypothetical protein
MRAPPAFGSLLPDKIRGSSLKATAALGKTGALFSDEQAFGLPFLDQANSQRKHNEGSSDGLTNSTTD